MKKKLVFFIGGLNFGGMERVVFIAEQLLRNEYDTYIVTLYQTESDYKEISAKLYDLNVPPSNDKCKKAIGFVKRIIRTKKMKRDLKPDVVFSFGMYSNYLNAITKMDEKIIMGIRSYDWLTNPFMTKKLDKKVVHRFDSLNSVSRMIAVDAIDKWELQDKKVDTIYNPYDIELIKEKAQDKIDDFIFDSRCFYFITMGRLADQKGYNHLIHSFFKLHEERNNARLIIMGDGSRKNHIEKLIFEYGLQECIYLIGGKTNPYKYICKADCYVLSSHTEGFPNALVEAMCLGKITIAANCPSGPSEIFLDEPFYNLSTTNFIVKDNGILSSKFQYDDTYCRRELQEEESTFAEAMKYVMDNAGKLSYVGTNACNRASEFGYEEFKSNLLKEIQSVLT